MNKFLIRKIQISILVLLFLTGGLFWNEILPEIDFRQALVLCVFVMGFDWICTLGRKGKNRCSFDFILDSVFLFFFVFLGLPLMDLFF